MTLDELRIMRLDEVLQVCGLSRSTLYKLIDQGMFPRPVQIGLRSVGWRQAEVLEWLKSRPLTSGPRDRG